MSDRADWNTQVIEEFRANEGRVRAFAQQPLLLLTHRGSKTGIERTNPLAVFRDGNDYVIVASKGGAPTNPDWYHNVVTHPEVRVELGTETFDAVARVPDPEERERLWAMIVAQNPAFGEYETKTSRTIPVLVLTRTS